MKKNKKAGLLILILAVPAFVVLIGSFFNTEHKFELPYFGDSSVDDVPVVSFDQDTIVLGQDSSVISIISFQCKEEQNVSNKVLSELTRVQEFYGQMSIPVNLYSIFACNESPDYIKEMQSLYNVEDTFWKFVWPATGIKPFSETFGVVLDRESKDYSEQSFSSVYLLDKQMKIRGFYNGYSNDDVNKLIEDIRVLIHEYE